MFALDHQSFCLLLIGTPASSFFVLPAPFAWFSSILFSIPITFFTAAPTKGPATAHDYLYPSSFENDDSASLFFSCPALNTLFFLESILNQISVTGLTTGLELFLAQVPRFWFGGGAGWQHWGFQGAFASSWRGVGVRGRRALATQGLRWFQWSWPQ